MARVVVQHGSAMVLHRSDDAYVSAVDTINGRYGIEVTDSTGATVVIHMSQLEFIALSAQMRSEIADQEDRGTWTGLSIEQRRLSRGVAARRSR